MPQNHTGDEMPSFTLNESVANKGSFICHVFLCFIPYFNGEPNDPIFDDEPFKPQVSIPIKKPPVGVVFSIGGR